MKTLWNDPEYTRGTPPIEMISPITEVLTAGAPVAIGVSGGKDSTATAFVTLEYLNAVGHQAPRILIHSDLGRVEWRDSLPTCQRLADRLDIELVVVKRKAGDLLDRWKVRWANNCARYASLSCVKIILPWSTPAMRFCTSELKTAIICRDLVERYPQQTIVSVVGLRRQESPSRAQAPICSPQQGLRSKTFKTEGYTWHPILAWTREDVLAYHEKQEFPLHEAYRVYGTTRVSCAFCILGSQHDLQAASTCADNADLYREMVELEIQSTFSFQEKHWLGDVAPHLLDGDAFLRLQKSKQRAVQREAVEAHIPDHLLYCKGWPTTMPTRSEALVLSTVRRQIAEIMEMSVSYTDPESVLERYAELIALNNQKTRKVLAGERSFPPHHEQLTTLPGGEQ